MSIYNDIPVNVLKFWIQEWEDYGQTGIGDVNGDPLRTDEYLSLDDYGEYPIGPSLRPHLLVELKEDDELIRKVINAVCRWLESESFGIDTHEHLSDCFELENDIKWKEEINE